MRSLRFALHDSNAQLLSTVIVVIVVVVVFAVAVGVAEAVKTVKFGKFGTFLEFSFLLRIRPRCAAIRLPLFM